jgi:hypothetical protein
MIRQHQVRISVSQNGILQKKWTAPIITPPKLGTPTIFTQTTSSIHRPPTPVTHVSTNIVAPVSNNGGSNDIRKQEVKVIGPGGCASCNKKRAISQQQSTPSNPIVVNMPQPPTSLLTAKVGDNVIVKKIVAPIAMVTGNDENLFYKPITISSVNVTNTGDNIANNESKEVKIIDNVAAAVSLGDEKRIASAPSKMTTAIVYAGGGTKEWSGPTWDYLHTQGYYYSSNPSDSEKSQKLTLFRSILDNIPCQTCKRESSSWESTNLLTNAVSNNCTLSKWVLDLHNHVNKGLGRSEWEMKQVVERYKFPSSPC